MRQNLLRRLTAAIPPVLRRNPRLAASGLVALAALVVIAVLAASQAPAAAPTTAAPSFSYSGTWTLLELQRHIEAGDVVAVSVGGDATASADAGELAAKTRAGQVVRVSLAVSSADALSALTALGDGKLLTDEAWQAAQASGTSTRPTSDDGLRSFLSFVLPIALMVVLLVVMVRIMARPTGGRRDTPSNFRTILPPSATDEEIGGRKVARPEARLARMEDVAGCDEAKLELTEAIDFLRSPERFRRLGATIPRGILLYGPPGTGKTMLAKAVAAEAGVPFHYTSGSEFVEKYVGVGARRMRDLFSQARKHGRGVIFVDEFDALGKARGGQNSHEEREQTLNQLLVEMDGFSSTDDLIVIAATNRIDVLDSAVLRPGRFTRKIHVGLPDVVGRRAILDVHARRKPLAAAADLDLLARKTYGFSGAQLADLLNEAAIFAARREGTEIENDDLHDGWLKVAVGTGRKRSMDERERSIIAAHEVGHAICSRVHGDRRTVEEISLFAHGDALGVTVSSQEDNDLPAESDLRARLVALMGGRAAEELLFQEVTGGASNDFEKANQIATTMVTRWGMGRDPEAADGGRSGRGTLSLLVARPGGSLPSEVQAAATRAIRAILDEAYEQATATLVAEMERLRRISGYLVEHERVDGETFAALFEGTLEVTDALREWRPASARPRDWTEIPEFADRRRVRPAPEPVPAAEPVPAIDAPAPAPAPGPVVEPVPVPAGRSPAPRLRRAPPPRPTLRRRVRGLALAWVRRADSWLASPPDAVTPGPASSSVPGEPAARS
ncbi:MAG TPA: AAA family ATPase [Candidatus Limnocylindrales bacterium]